MTYQIQTEFNDILLTDANGEEYRMPAEFRELVARYLEPITEADRSGKLKGEAYWYPRFEQFEEALTDITAVRDALNELTDDGNRQRQMVRLVYDELPDWTKSRELLESKFKVRIMEPALMVSKGYVRSDINFVNEQFAQKYA